MYNRIAHKLVTPPGAMPMWEYQLNPLDCGGENESHRRGEYCDFFFSVGVYIPHADFPVVLDRLRLRRRQSSAAKGESD